MNTAWFALHSGGEAGAGAKGLPANPDYGQKPSYCVNLNLLETIMKKLLIASVSVLALSAGAAFAGSNGSDVEQIGSTLSATVGQTINGGSSNSSTIYQGYSGNGDPAYNSGATVTQIGGAGSTISSGIQQNDGYQNATVYQDGSKGGSQSSGITQSYYGNTANVTQVSAGGSQASSVTQSGAYNQATVSQAGVNDSSTVSQTGWYNNNGYILGTPVGGVYGGVNVSQSGGSTNSSGVTQASYASGVDVIQGGTGGSNSSSVNQTDSYYQGAYVSQTANGGSNTSYITQGGGNSNGAAVIQSASGGVNWSNIVQSGAGNSAYLSQTAASGVSNTQTISQTGSGNVASVTQH
jgi:hypothetical protein